MVLAPALGNHIGLDVRSNHQQKKFITFKYYLTWLPPTTLLRDNWCSQMFVEVHPNNERRALWKDESDINPCTVLKRGQTTMTTDVDELLKLGWMSFWVIHIKLKLYSPKMQTGQIGSIQPSLEQFQVISMAKARRDLVAGLVQNPIVGEIKIISSDGAEFSAPKGILAARSPVFAAMFRTNMTEVKDGIVRLPDISGMTLKVLLNFIYTGELQPGWKESGVIVEFTNAAAKYQLSDLLEFLDLMLGEVCDLQNVTPLLALASRLSMKRAEKDLLKFVSEKGTTSAHNFFQMIKALAGVDSINI